MGETPTTKTSERYHVAVDTREQRPYGFEDTIRKKLDAGDYSVCGYENRIAIERKSLEDWINTILRGRERFAREIERLKEYDFAAIVIEATPAEIMAGQYRADIRPSALLALTADLVIRFRPINVILGGSRPGAAALTLALLRTATNYCDNLDAARANEAELEAIREVVADQ